MIVKFDYIREMESFLNPLNTFFLYLFEISIFYNTW